jgi:hypothetical protein
VTTEETKQHPYQLGSGLYPHDQRPAHFREWLRRNSLKEDHYWLVLGRDLNLTDMFGTPVLTAGLSNDQRGWAKQRYPRHYMTPGAKWYRRNNSSVPVPAIKLTPDSPHRRRRRHS